MVDGLHGRRIWRRAGVPPAECPGRLQSRRSGHRDHFLLPAERVSGSPDRLIEWRGRPGTIRDDNCLDYISGTLLGWVESRQITIHPAHPTQPAATERIQRALQPHDPARRARPIYHRNYRGGSGLRHRLAVDL